jgi:hypothetical protein
VVQTQLDTIFLIFISCTCYQHDFHLFDVRMDTLRTMFDLGLGGIFFGVRLADSLAQ